MADRSSTAILIFSRTASEEAAVKTFVPAIGKSGNAAIADGLINQSIAVARQTDLPVILASSAQQVGSSFGERLANALESVYAQGYKKVLVIGNDCPALTSADLLHAKAKLDQNQLVLGPATDGGLYLIGLDRKAYQRGAFVALPWNQSSLQQGWKNYANSLSKASDWLGAQRDVDQASDFSWMLRLRTGSLWLHRYLTSILASYQANPSRSSLRLHTSATLRNRFLRGPPQHTFLFA